MSDMILSMHSLGKTRIPPENPTDAQIAVYIKDLLALEDGLTVAVRFEIGNTIHDMDIEHGEKFDFCKKNFGEGRAKKVLEYAAIARAWVFNQNVGWSWSYYRELVKATKKDKEDFVKLYKQGRLKSIEQMKELYAELTGKTSEKQAIQDQNPHVGILKQSSSDVIDAEYKPAAPALPTPEPHVYADRYDDIDADYEKNNPSPYDPAPVVGFKVEGDTVHRQELRFASPVSDIPPYLRQTPPEGLTDNGRQVIGAVCAMECDVPEVIYVRCVVPKGMTVTEDQLLTVAIVRCQLP